MPTKAKKNSTTSTNFSLISNETFAAMWKAMKELRRHAKGRRGWARGLEAMLAATTVDLRKSDVIAFSKQLSPLPNGLTRDTVQTVSTSAEAAAGAALGLRAAGSDGVVVVFGKSVEPPGREWNEAFRLAGNCALPILFVLLPERSAEAERSVAAIASEATAAGIVSMPVDAIDAVALYRVAFESIARARRGTGATLIVGTHYALENQRQMYPGDPIERLESYLKHKGMAMASLERDPPKAAKTTKVRKQ
jgi:hypothetical protein